MKRATMPIEWRDKLRGYVVRSQRHGGDTLKVFSVSKHGTKRAARLAAQEYEGHRVRQERLGYGYEPKLARATMADLYDYWLPSKATVAHSTRAKYVTAWRAHIEPTFGQRKIAAVRTFDVGVWMGELTTRLAPSTCLEAHRVLSMMLDTAVKAGVVEANVAKGVKAPKVTAGRQRFLSPAQVAELARACGEWEDLVLVLAYTGLRWSEAVGLRIDDFDTDRSRLHINRVLVETDGKLRSKPPKSGRTRTVPVPEFIAEHLRVRCSASTSPLGLIFHNPEGGPIYRSRWRQSVWLPATRKCSGLVGFTVRDLRHTYASIAISNGATPKTLQRAMGHSTARLTLDTYAGLFDADLDRLADTLHQTHLDQTSESEVKTRLIRKEDSPGE